MIAPTPNQLEILRLMAAGVQLEPADRTQAHLVLNGVRCRIVRTGTVAALLEAGWIARRPDTTYELTKDGRARAETNTFVRAFADGMRGPE